MRTWDLINLLFRSTNRLSLAVVCLFLLFKHFVCFGVLFFTNLIPLDHRLKDIVTCIQMHKTFHYNIISWSSQHYIRLACISLVINKGNTRFK